MDHDDIFSPVLGRRDILRTAGAMSILSFVQWNALRAAALGPVDAADDFSDCVDDARYQAVCTMTPSETQGPYWLNTGLVRSDIREGRPGLNTLMNIHVVHASDCTPIAGADVDVWHCDHLGRYSGIASLGTAGQTFLRGIQPTDSAGTASFTTIFPGWYMGRATHIHIKVTPPGAPTLTSQMYFLQRLVNRVQSRAPYTAHGTNSLTNVNDGLFLPATVMSLLSASGAQLVTELTIGVA